MIPDSQNIGDIKSMKTDEMQLHMSTWVNVTNTILSNHRNQSPKTFSIIPFFKAQETGKIKVQYLGMHADMVKQSSQSGKWFS